MKSPKLKNFSLRELFSQPLRIPEYQRAYSWRTAHVSDLLNDTFGRTSPYLMGTIILHETVASPDNPQMVLNIVDGQQRLVTLTVILHVLRGLLDCQSDIPLPLLDGMFPDGAAKVIRNTKSIIVNFLNQKSREEISAYCNLLLAGKETENGGRLEFSTLVLNGKNALDQAYTFFDSVNSKGKPLSDYDLLKAHHLMFIPPQQEALATSHNKEWQSGDENHNLLFSIILRRLRMWGRGENRDSKQERPDYNEFSSVVEPDHSVGGEHVFNRYMQPAAFRSWRRDGEKIVLSMDYPMLEGEALIPTEVTQTIEGGDAFFLYAKRYHGLYSTLFSPETKGVSTAIAFIRKMAIHMDNIYLQNAFRAAILLSFDKFGEDRLLEIAVYTEHIISARRWDPKSLRIEGALDHVRNNKIIPILLNSVSSAHVIVQLHSAAKMLPYITPQDFTGVRRRYFDFMQGFYVQERSKILDARTSDLVSFYFNK